jgi:hypothetical protein
MTPNTGQQITATITTGGNSAVTADAAQPTGLPHQRTGHAFNHATKLGQPSADPAALRRTGDTKPQETEPAEPRRRRALARSGR